MGWTVSQLIHLSRGSSEVYQELLYLQAKNDALDNAEKDLQSEQVPREKE